MKPAAATLEGFPRYSMRQFFFQTMEVRPLRARRHPCRRSSLKDEMGCGLLDRPRLVLVARTPTLMKCGLSCPPATVPVWLSKVGLDQFPMDRADLGVRTTNDSCSRLDRHKQPFTNSAFVIYQAPFNYDSVLIFLRNQMRSARSD